MSASLDRDAVLHALSKRGSNLKKWCTEQKYGYRNASNVLRGVSRAHFGQGRDIYQKLKKLEEEELANG